MSAFTDNAYRTWLARFGSVSSGRRSGYGAEPHAERREGYPTGQTHPQETVRGRTSTCLHPASQASSRPGSQRAKDAASRPEKPAVGIPAAPALFLHQPEKSSAK